MRDFVYAYRCESTGEIAVGYAQAPVPRHAGTADLALCFEIEPAPELTDAEVFEACRGLVLFVETLERG